MPRKHSVELTTSSVNFEVDVIQYLERLANQEERSRSFLINKIVREYAERQGTPIRRRQAEEQPEA